MSQSYIMEYLGTARLLVETHNKYMKCLQMDPHGGEDEEHAEMMDAFVDDFNNTSDSFHIAKNGREYGIFDRSEP